jgi:rare lipoprotein A
MLLLLHSLLMRLLTCLKNHSVYGRYVQCTLVCGLTLVASACATSSAQTPLISPTPAPAPLAQEKSAQQSTPNNADWNGTVKIGRPYQIDNVWYYPEDNVFYEETGIASWYGSDFHGKPTANGEPYDMNELSAAHRTLPMPSYIEVTNLSNGRSLVLRVNDRGPFKAARIVDVSRRAAQLLGFDNNGTAKVHVKRVFPEDAPEVMLAARPGMPASETPRSPVPPAWPASEITTAELPPALRPSPPRLATKMPEGQNLVNAYYIQVAAVGDQKRAQVLVADLERFGQVIIEPAQSAQGKIFRVRIGPFISRDTAEKIMNQVRAIGYSEALVLSPAVG